MNEVNVILEVDGEKIPINEFVNKILYGMISGSIGALHGVDENWRTINISIKR